MAFLGKVYTFEKQENFDGFLQSVGVPEETIKAFLTFKSTQKLEKDGDSYTLSFLTLQGPKTITFKSGVEFDEVMGDGEPVKSTYTVDGNTVTQTAKSAKGTGTFKREFNGDELLVTITSDKWDGLARRYYKA